MDKIISTVLFKQSHLSLVKDLIKRKEKIYLVMGNVSCDMDSVMSSFLLSFCLSKKYEGRLVLPLINSEEDGLRARKDIAFMLKEYSVELSGLLYYKEFMNMGYEHFDLYLVDHNELDINQTHLHKNVKGVMDHHKDNCNFADLLFRAIKPASSAISVIYECYNCLLSPEDKVFFSKMILSTFYLDTNGYLDCFYNVKFFDKDIEIRDELEELNKKGMDEQYYKDLSQIKKSSFDINNNPFKSLLDLDYKNYSYSDCKYGISSLMMTLEDVREKNSNETVLGLINDFLLQKSLDFHISFFHAFKGEKMVKQMLIVSNGFSGYSQFISKVEGLDFVEKKEEFYCEGKSVLFNLINTKYTRKTAEPILRGLI